MAVSGLLMAFDVVLIILSGVLDFNTLFFLAAAAFLIGVIIREYDLRYGLAFFLGCLILGALLAPQKLYCITYAMMGIESRGQLLIDPGTEVYEGMIVGENSRENDITVNITKGKNLTNVRAAGSDEMAHIKTPTHFSLEESLEFLNEDEYCEVTPENIRLRKQILNTNAREKAAKRRKAASRK